MNRKLWHFYTKKKAKKSCALQCNFIESWVADSKRRYIRMHLKSYSKKIRYHTNARRTSNCSIMVLPSNMNSTYDFLLWDKIGVELKTFSEITGEFESQIINYLHVSNHELGVILNFGTVSLQYKWFPNTWDRRPTANIG